ncbi:MAG: hypothetical protein HYX69_00205 [Planctomycetia bacterium]|nr:hypothetical protein [Planctomycetia bacterium]
MATGRWQISIRRLFWATLLMAICLAMEARADLSETMAAPLIVFVIALQTLLFLVAVHAPFVYAKRAALVIIPAMALLFAAMVYLTIIWY